MKKLITLLGFLSLIIALKAQNGSIDGKVTDENGEGVPYANVILVDDKGITTGRGANTDADGNYTVSQLTPGKYNLQFSYVGYASQIQQGVVVHNELATHIDVKLKPATTELKQVEIISYKVPLIDPSNTSSKNTVTAEEIANMATKSVQDIAASTAGVFQSDQGGSLNIKGGRSDGTQYYIDGVKVYGDPVVPVSSIEQLEVITGGIPAKYGDISGGIINITSKGPSSEWHGSVEYQTTQGLDAYGYNLVDASLTGPLLKEKKTHRTIIGIFTAFEYQNQLDPNPSAVGVWQVKPSVLDSLNASPLVRTPSGFNLSSANVGYWDMFKQAVKPNTQETDYRGNARIDIRPVDNITVTLGGSASYKASHQWVEQYTLLNSVNNPIDNVLDWRVYGRFTHNIQSRQTEEETKDGKKKKASAFQNAYYSIQFDYEKFKEQLQGAGGTNPFDYGYIGKFDTKTTPVFAFDTFQATPNGKVYQGWKQVGTADTAVVYTPSNINPNSSNFTTEYYQLLGATKAADGSYEVYNLNNAAFTANEFEIQENQGLINGERSNIVNNLWYNTGRAFNGYGYENYSGAPGNVNSQDPNQPGGGNSDQYRVRLEGAFDILKPGAPNRNKHSFEFGIEYEQRIERTYAVNPLGIWQIARDLVNLQLVNPDRTDPTFRINGQNYSLNSPNMPTFYPTDTIFFHQAYNAGQQSWFDKELRQALGEAVNSTNILNVDDYSPTFLKMTMFSPDELLNEGAGVVQYAGYDPYGNQLTRQPSFNDFFTKTDANGNLIRAVPAYEPIYTDAYLSDRFYFKDLTFNVGVRVDRFDANQEVLKDQYSLYPIYTAGQVTNLDGNAVSRPSDISANDYVYVDNSKDPTQIVGYRDANGNWYDKYGTQLANGAALAAATSTGTIQPYLKNPNEDIQIPSTFDPSGTFTQYVPKIIVMPRLQFSFNLTDMALFYAHYDILSQRPNSQQVAENPEEYLYYLANPFSSILSNPDLKPQTTVDYELGFKQRVSNSAAFTFSAFYREFRNQIQVDKIIDAYPKDYITYGNLDFGTTKGFTLDFDLRRTANFSLKANYTLQFADGTGSDPTTQFNIVQATGTNFLTIAPLNYDARHLVNVSVTYSYGVGKDYNGPIIKNKQILSDAGISLQLTARSGTPYTAQENATATQLQNQPLKPVTEGSINGSRLPWYFRVNMRVYKNFNFTTGGKTGKKKENKEKKGEGRALGLQLYLQIQNLLNTENVIQVYRYTGSPSDDGFLNDPSSISAIAGALNPKAFKDQYAAVENSPNSYSIPRRIYLGGIFTF